MTPPPAPPRTYAPGTDARLMASDPWPPARDLHPLAPPTPRVEVVDLVLAGAIVAACLMGVALVMA